MTKSPSRSISPHKVLRSALSTRPGWFPAGYPRSHRHPTPFYSTLPHFEDYLAGNRGIHDKDLPHNKVDVRLTTDTKLTDCFENGVMLSELVAHLLTDDRGMVKQVEQYDQYGRLSCPPKLLLVGTSFIVKSKAQALQNIRISLQVLSQVHNFPKVLHSAQEVLKDRNLMQEIFDTICSCFSLPRITSSKTLTLFLLQRRSLIAKRLQNRSSSAPPRLCPSDAKTPVRSYGGEFSAVKRGYSDKALRNANHYESRGRSPEPRRSLELPQPTTGGSNHKVAHGSERLGRQIETTLSAGTRKGRSRSYSPGLIKQLKEQDEMGYVTNSQSGRVIREVPLSSRKKTTTKKKELSQRERVRKHEMRKERLKVQMKDRMTKRRSLVSQLYDDAEIKSKPATTSTSSSMKSSDQTRKPQDSLKIKTSGSTLVVGPTSSSSAASTHEASKAKSEEKKMFKAKSEMASGGSINWFPPKPNDWELAAAKQVNVKKISTAQQRAVRDWLLSLGLSVMDGEGGYFYHDHMRNEGSVSIPPAIPQSMPILPLQDDRLRNGVMLCQLIAKLEPDATIHANIHKLVYFQPVTVCKALDNLEKALWILKVKSCPPLPSHLLVQPELFLQGNKHAIWGLLWEIMQVYSSSSDQPRTSLFKPRVGALKDLPIDQQFYRASKPVDSKESGRSSQPHGLRLPYSSQQRRQLDQSLTEWIDSLQVIRDNLGLFARPLTILALESFLKDGTLLCAITENVLDIPLSSAYLRHPHTYSQCLANVTKCIDALRASKMISPRFLYNGVEEEIVRGHWDAILGLLEDLHIVCDRIQAYHNYYKLIHRSDKSTNLTSYLISLNRKEVPSYPYLGQRKIIQLEHQRGLLCAHSSVRSSFSSVDSQPVRAGLSSVSLDFLVPPQDNSDVKDHVATSSKSKLPTVEQVKHISEDPTKVKLHADDFLLAPEFKPRLDLTASFPWISTDESLDERRKNEHDLVPKPLSPVHSLDNIEALQQVLNSPQLFDPPRIVNPITSIELDETDRFTISPTQAVRAMHDVPHRTPLKVLHHIAPMDASNVDQFHIDQTLSIADEDDEDDYDKKYASLHDSLDVIDENRNQRLHQPIFSIDGLDKDEDIAEKDLIRLFRVGRWLKDLNIKVDLQVIKAENVGKIQYLSRCVQELAKQFIDGVQLGILVQKLERCPIPGLEIMPKSAGQRFQNVRKTLEFLAERNKRVPLRVLSCEEEIMEGNGFALLELLEQLKRVYPLFKTKGK